MVYSKWVVHGLQSLGNKVCKLQQSRLCPQTSSHHTELLFCLFLWDVSVEHLLPHIVVHVTCEMNFPHLCLLGPVFCLTLGEAWLAFLPAQTQGCGVWRGSQAYRIVFLATVLLVKKQKATSANCQPALAFRMTQSLRRQVTWNLIKYLYTLVLLKNIPSVLCCKKLTVIISLPLNPK